MAGIDRAKIVARLTKAFDGKLNEALTSLTLVDRKAGTYNTATGTMTSNDVSYATRGVVSTFSTLEVAMSNGMIDLDDVKITLLASDLAIEPKTTHIMQIGGVDYKIMEVKPDPMNISYMLRLK